MPNKGNYDWDYRPKTYWVYPDMKQRVLATVKGNVRRSQAIRALEDPVRFFYDPANFQESLSEEEKLAQGRIHPILMGGEYLPNLRQGEVEIARVSMKSVMGDSVSVRARWKNGKICYDVVDEHRTKYIFLPESSDVPLTFGELINLIDTATEGEDFRYWLTGGLVIAQLEYNYEACGNLENIIGFVTVSSAFYPGLSEWYEEACDEWFERKRAEAADAEDEE